MSNQQDNRSNQITSYEYIKNFYERGDTLKISFDFRVPLTNYLVEEMCRHMKHVGPYLEKTHVTVIELNYWKNFFSDLVEQNVKDKFFNSLRSNKTVTTLFSFGTKFSQGDLLKLAMLATYKKHVQQIPFELDDFPFDQLNLLPFDEDEASRKTFEDEASRKAYEASRKTYENADEDSRKAYEDKLLKHMFDNKMY
jgi:hypothetical protein